MGGKFRNVEHWYINNKQADPQTFDYIKDKTELRKKLKKEDAKNKDLDDLWELPRDCFPSLPFRADEQDHESLLKVYLCANTASLVLDYLLQPQDIEARVCAQKGDGLLILFEGQSDHAWGARTSDLAGQSLEVDVDSTITRKRTTCASWLPHGASYNFPRDGQCTLVVHHVSPEVKTIVVQEIESYRGRGGYWGEGDVLMQPNVQITVTQIDVVNGFESYDTSCSAVVTRRGPVRVVHTLVSLPLVSLPLVSEICDS
jgi:hypothetical protein